MIGLAKDDHSRRARRVHDGLFRIAHLCRKQFGSGKLTAFDSWKQSALGSNSKICRRRRQTKGYRLRTLLAAVLLLMLAGCFSLPSVLYTMATNVESWPGVLAPFRYAIFVVVCNLVLQNVLLSKAALWIARLRTHGVEDDFIAFNKTRLCTIYLSLFSSEILGPVFSTMIYDENCLRRYLEFSEGLKKIMDDWELGMQGFDAFRPGFCLPKVITQYSPVWNTRAAVEVFVLPSLLVVQASPQYKSAVRWLKLKLRRSRASFEDQMESKVVDMQLRLGSALTFLTVCLAFGVWVPNLLLLLAAFAPVSLFTDRVCVALESRAEESEEPKVENLDDKFCTQVVELIKVPSIKSLPVAIILLSCPLSMLLVFLDFGFGLGPWLFIALTAPLIVAGRVYSLRQYGGRQHKGDDDSSDDDDEHNVSDHAEDMAFHKNDIFAPTHHKPDSGADAPLSPANTVCSPDRDLEILPPLRDTQAKRAAVLKEVKLERFRRGKGKHEGRKSPKKKEVASMSMEAVQIEIPDLSACTKRRRARLGLFLAPPAACTEHEHDSVLDV
eukprot:TRINITY_DN7869_c0_g1_i3.p1 TRINITY_DN7869_c0_g1~~TRINITY_DN7869_c0_g1_i3.p1  ORF type:complete len:554 (-),score=133.36 TRINITY_DN7869_c0_g1_i3:335-1996(-)